MIIKLVIGALVLMSTAMGEFHGDLTTYGLSQPSSGNCNMMDSPSSAISNYAAINDPQWDGSKSCGRCAEVTCVDDRCSDHSKTSIVNIIDRCPECKVGDLDVSPSVFSYLTGSSPSRYKIKWRFVDCPVTGNIKYCLKGGSNSFWVAIQPANMVTGVQSMTINGQSTRMVDSAYYYLFDGKGAVQNDLSSIQVKLISVNGEVIQDTVSLQAGQCTEGRYQFSRGQSGGSTTPTNQGTTPSTNAPTQHVSTSPSPSKNETTINHQVGTKQHNTPVEEKGSSSGDGSSSSSVGTDALVHEPHDISTSSNHSDSSTQSTLQEQVQHEQVQHDSSVGIKNHVTTQARGTIATSPAIIALIIVAGVGVVALTVFAVIVKRKRLQDKVNDRDDAFMILEPNTQCGMNQLSFSSTDPTPLCHTSRPSRGATPNINARMDVALL